MTFMYGLSMSTPRISERRTYRRNLFNAGAGKKIKMKFTWKQASEFHFDNEWKRARKEKNWRVLGLTKTRLFVGRKLHKVWTGAGRGAVVIDETQMWTGTTSIIPLARVGGWWGREEDGERLRTRGTRNKQRDRLWYSTRLKTFAAWYYGASLVVPLGEINSSKQTRRK